jgi:type I restriction enzyme, S subunit
MAKLAQMPKHDSYKNSGIDWLGQLPSDWDAIRMKFLFKDTSIKNRPKETLLSVTQNQGVVPRTWVENRMVMPSGNLESFKFIEHGDFAISLRSFEGGLEYCHHDGIISPAYTVLKTKRPDLINGFYKYLFKSQAFISELQTSVVGIREGKNISYEELQYSLLPVLSVAEQVAIANFLDKKTAQVDEAVAIKQQQIELLKERKQIIIQQAVTQGLNPDAPMKDSGVDWIGKIPEHWQVKKLKYLIKFVGGGTPSKENSDFWGGDVCWVSPKDMKVKYITDSIDKITEVAVKKSSVKLLPTNTVLIVVRGMILAKKIPIAITTKPLTINQDMKGMIVKADCNSKYLLNLLDGLHEELSTILEESGHGTKTMPTDKLGGFKLPFPPESEQNEIIKFVENESNKFDKAVDFQIQQIEKLKEYKTTLINSAVTGKIKVPQNQESVLS